LTEAVSQKTTSNETLPDSWEWAAYSELGDWSGGGTPSKSNPSYWEGGNVPWFSPKDMRGLELHDSQDHITNVALQDSSAKPIGAGSLLFVVRSGILRRTLPVALTTIDGAVNQDIKALIPSKSLSAKYLLYATLAQKEEIRHKCKKAGTTVESIQVTSLTDLCKGI
jgi:type I restriction enzyme S subunit